MVRESCVVHPAKARIVLYRDWQFDVCGGDPVGAALLNFFEYWHNIKLANQPQAKTYNNVAEAGGDGRPQPETLYQWHTEAEIIHGLVGLAGKDKIRSAINKIVDLGFVTVHKNPNPKFSFDKTKHFLFHPDRINKYLKELETIENPDQRNIGDRSTEIRHIDQRNIGDDGRNIGDDQRNIGEQYQRLHSLTTSKEEIKDPLYPPSGSDVTNPEPRLSSLSESKNSIDVDFWEEIVQYTLQSDSQNPPPRTQENNGQDLIVEYDTPRSLQGAFTEGKSPNSDSNAETPNKTSLLLFSSPGVAVYSAPPDDYLPPKKKAKKSAYEDGFEDIFWPIVAHKTNKQGARAKWAKTKGVDPWHVRECYLRQFEAHVEGGNDPKFFRRPEAWLHQLGWEDELPDPRLAGLKPKTSAEVREEQKQAEMEARKAETLRLIALRQQANQV